MRSFSPTQGRSFGSSIWAPDNPGIATVQSMIFSSSAHNAGNTITGSGTVSTGSGSAIGASSLSNTGHGTGKYYWEWIGTTLGAYPLWGLCNGNTSGFYDNYMGGTSQGCSFPSDGSAAYVAGMTSAGYVLPLMSSGDIVGGCVDLGAGKVWFHRNGVYPSGGNPSTGTNPAFTFTPSGTYYTGISQQTGNVTTISAAFKYAIPLGFLPW